MYICWYRVMHHIEMCRTVDCVHEISVYRYHSKVVYRDITNKIAEQLDINAINRASL